MNNKVIWIIRLGIASLILSGAATVATRFAKGGTDWATALLASSIFAIACAFIPFVKSVQESHDDLKQRADALDNKIQRGTNDLTAKLDMLQRIVAPDTDDLWLLRQLIRSTSFRVPPRIDPLFWTAYGQFTLERRNAHQYDLMNELADAFERGTVVINGPVPIYQMMALLFSQIQRKGHQYHASATESEVHQDHAQFFIFELPKQYPTLVSRIFLIKEWKSFSDGLNENQRADLMEQIEGGAELHALITPNPEDEPNIGVYGEIATGRLVSNEQNIFNFNPDAVSENNGLFKLLLPRSSRIDLHVDGNGRRKLVLKGATRP